MTVHLIRLAKGVGVFSYATYCGDQYFNGGEKWEAMRFDSKESAERAVALTFPYGNATLKFEIVPAESKVLDAMKGLWQMPLSDRMEALGEFCRDCGGKAPCNCMRDD